MDDMIPVEKRQFSWASLEYYINVAMNDDVAIGIMFERNKNRIERCPASTKYHGCYHGGLIDHIVPVCSNALEIARIYGFKEEERVSLVKCALLHDIGKLGDDTEEMFLVNPDEALQEKEPFIYNTRLVKIPHEMYSVFWCNQWNIKLRSEEVQAIAYHNGAYHDGFKSAVGTKESKLLLVLHAADLLTSRINEQCVRGN